MRVSLKSALAAGIALGALAMGASAAVIQVQSTVPESGYGFSFDPTTGQFSGLQSGGSYPLTGPSGYNFAGTPYSTLTSIDKLTVTLTINDGDSAQGDFDFNNLTLRLDGLDTGLVLNGFPNNGVLTLDIEGPNNAAGLLAALKNDGILVGTVFDADTDGVSQTAPDFIGFPAATVTTLVIEGQAEGAIPLPAAVLMAPLGAGLVGMCQRRFRRK
jgi:hypothetical protein